MQDSRLTSLEARIPRRCALLKGFPSWGFNRTSLEYNIKYWIERAGLRWDKVVAILLDSNSSILRLEFSTENQKIKFMQHCKSVKCEWILDYSKSKMKIENGIPPVVDSQNNPSTHYWTSFRPCSQIVTKDKMVNFLQTRILFKFGFIPLQPALPC